MVACYDFVWRTAFGNLKPASGSSNLVSSYQKTLDNFYSHQYQDGLACRELCENEPEEQGVENYRFNGRSMGLLCEARAAEGEDPIVTALCEKPL